MGFSIKNFILVCTMLSSGAAMADVEGFVFSVAKSDRCSLAFDDCDQTLEFLKNANRREADEKCTPPTHATQVTDTYVLQRKIGYNERIDVSAAYRCDR